ncbi:MAG: DNA-formamidopyrimidine glycosylase family protein [Ilumatobacteraceae bacterium]
MPEIPEIQAHAERLEADYEGATLKRFVPLTFTALKTAVPAPDAAYGERLVGVGRRGKHLLLEFEPVTFVVHLMQGGRLLPDTKMSRKPRNGQARFLFDGEVPALLLTEAGTERRAGVWCVPSSEVMTSPPLDHLGPEAGSIEPDELASAVRAALDAAARVPARPVDDRRRRSAAGQRDLPPGEAVAVRVDEEARSRGRGDRGAGDACVDRREPRVRTWSR